MTKRTDRTDLTALADRSFRALDPREFTPDRADGFRTPDALMVPVHHDATRFQVGAVPEAGRTRSADGRRFAPVGRPGGPDAGTAARGGGGEARPAAVGVSGRVEHTGERPGLCGLRPPAL
ncbi:hypothetical protein [Streptomyces sp. HF10]|uniref:hypothetical protein n=1 Tax=Streptomyces sp. HF10 TaxID=2692233 RepID=UPI001318385E|nr:hypothetical protein [Streptomyces sp. HF10]QHC31524.1 hypothetical protein GR129_24730 [Streptomyces sp. HF10]